MEIWNYRGSDLGDDMGTGTVGVDMEGKLEIGMVQVTQGRKGSTTPG